MSKKVFAFTLSSICIINFLIRVVYPYQPVLGGDFVSFVSNDAYNRMYYAKLFLSMGFGDGLMFMIHNNLLFSYITSVFNSVIPFEVAGAWLPPIFSTITLLAVYGIGASLFNRTTGILGMLFVAIIPSEFMHRSLLGFADHHALEIMLLTGFLYFLIKAVKAGRLMNRHLFLAGLASLLYMLNWVSGLYLLTGIAGITALSILVFNICNKQRWHTSLPVIIIPLALALAIYLPLGGYERIPWVGAGATPSVASHTTGEIVTTVLAPPSARTTSELMPLLSPYGSFNPIVIITNLHIFAPLSIVGLLLLWKYRHDRAMVIMIVSSLLFLAITLNQRRFMYYSTINIGLLSALALLHTTKQIKGNPMQALIIFCLPIVMVSLIFAKNLSSNLPFQMPTEWHRALTWLEKQEGEGMVSAWSDYGHWIKYVSGKNPNYLPGPGGELVAKLYLSREYDEAQGLLRQMNSSYFIVDKATLTQKMFAVSSVAGENPVSTSGLLAFQLYNENLVPPFMYLSYQSETIKIYSIVK